MLRLGGVLFAVLLATACSPARRIVRPPSRIDAPAVIAALAARERALAGQRIAMSVRSADGASALLSSPAYLAVDGPEALRLQVLSPFGVTVLDLAIRDGAYVLALPLRGETRHGTVDVDAFAASELPASERMVLALALFFRPKMRSDSCRAERDDTIACAVSAGMVAHVTVDAAGRPVDERYTGAADVELVRATYADYADASPGTLPGRIEIHDAASGTTMIVRVLRVRTAAAAQAR